jgi:hypothetical protein
MNDVDVLSTVVPAVMRVLHADARFVIRITSHGVTVIDNHLLVTDSIPLIVVTAVRQTPRGPKEVSVLEIGYQRARPYSRVHKARNRLRLERRSPSYEVSEPEFRLVYPEILRCLQTVLDETRARWRSTEPWWIQRGRPPVERGVEITVREDDLWLHEAFMREHVRFFRDSYLRRYAGWINHQLRHSKYNQYRTYGPNVKRVVESIRGSVYFKDPTLRDVLLARCSKRMLIESAFRDLHHVHLTTGVARPPWLYIDRRQPSAAPLFFRKTLDQPNGNQGHAQGCVRFEVFYDYRALQQVAPAADEDIPW